MMNDKFDSLRNPNIGTPETLELATITWIKSLEETKRPVTLAEKFPRIANRLAAIWADQATTVTYLDELMFDDRGGRKGFPIAIGLELATLKELVLSRKAPAFTGNVGALRR